MDASNQLVSVQPDELRFQFELEKQTYCDLKVSNSTDGNVAFKVKTTSPKKYFVRPNTGVIHPGGSSVIRVTLQAQKEYPAEAVSKDKFLLQTTLVSSNIETDSLSADTFNKDSGRVIEESKLRVLYISPNLPHGEADSTKIVKRNTDEVQDSNTNDNSVLRHLKEDIHAAARQKQQLQQELDILRRRRQSKGDAGFSMKFAAIVALIGMMLGFLLKFSLSSPSLE